MAESPTYVIKTVSLNTEHFYWAWGIGNAILLGPSEPDTWRNSVNICWMNEQISELGCGKIHLACLLLTVRIHWCVVTSYEIRNNQLVNNYKISGSSNYFSFLSFFLKIWRWFKVMSTLIFLHLFHSNMLSLIVTDMLLCLWLQMTVQLMIIGTSVYFLILPVNKFLTSKKARVDEGRR